MSYEAMEFFERHFLYAAWMLNGTRDRIESGHADVVIRNALIKSFCITARGLVDFFEGKKGAPKTVFTDETYVRWVHGEVPGNLITKVGYQIAHLTSRRTTVAEDKINRAAQQRIYEPLAAEIANFRKHLKTEYRYRWPPDLILPPTMAPLSPSLKLAEGPTGPPRIMDTTTNITSTGGWDPFKK